MPTFGFIKLWPPLDLWLPSLEFLYTRRPFRMGRKKDRNCLGPRNVYFKVSHVLKTTRDVKTLLNTIKSLKRFKKENLKASHWKLYWHEAQYCQKIIPPWKTDVSSKYLVRFRRTFLFSVILSFIKLDFIVIYSFFFENDQTMIKADEYCCQTSGLPTVTFFRQSRDLEAILVDVHVSFPLAICKHIIIRGFYRIWPNISSIVWTYNAP